MGSNVALGLNSLFATWVDPPVKNDPRGLNDVHLENIFFIAAGLSFCTFLVFVFVCRSFEYVEAPHNCVPGSHEEGESAVVSGLSPDLSLFGRSRRCSVAL